MTYSGLEGLSVMYLDYQLLLGGMWLDLVYNENDAVDTH